MSLLSETFVSEEAEDMSFDPLPVAEYTAQITKAEVKTTTAGTGEYISCQWTVLDAEDPKYVGRIVFQNLNIVNPSEMAVKIAKSQLKQITKAMGIAELVDTDELLGNPVKITLKIRPAKDGYDASNDVHKVKALSDEGEGTDGGGDPPWEDDIPY